MSREPPVASSMLVGPRRKRACSGAAMQTDSVAYRDASGLGRVRARVARRVLSIVNATAITTPALAPLALLSPIRKPSTNASTLTAMKRGNGNGRSSAFSAKWCFITVTFPGVPVIIVGGPSRFLYNVSSRLLERFRSSSSSSSSSASAEQNLPIKRNSVMPTAKPTVMLIVVPKSFGASLMIGTASEVQARTVRGGGSRCEKEAPGSSGCCARSSTATADSTMPAARCCSADTILAGTVIARER